MTKQDQKQLGRTLWNIADQLRGAMSADDFHDYILSFLFLRYLSDNYVEAIKNKLGDAYEYLIGQFAAGESGPLSVCRSGFGAGRSKVKRE